jgi:hypothetical protein
MTRGTTNNTNDKNESHVQAPTVGSQSAGGGRGGDGKDGCMADLSQKSITEGRRNTQTAATASQEILPQAHMPAPQQVNTTRQVQARHQNTQAEARQSRSQAESQGLAQSQSTGGRSR